jgi:hypothetical protein
MGCSEKYALRNISKYVDMKGSISYNIKKQMM